MITELSELTMAQFIKLTNGDTSVLLRHNEIVSPKKIAKAVRKIGHEFRRIADPAEFNAFLSRNEEIAKLKLNELFLMICNTLAAMNEMRALSGLLDERGFDTSGMNRQQIVKLIKSELALCRMTLNRIKQDTLESWPAKAAHAKTDFDALTANLMSHFKFQIDINSISASVYAHLIAQMCSEMKAKTAALKKRHF